MTNPTPGYYDDGHGVQRYWNGKAWTQQTQPDPVTAAAGAEPEVPPAVGERGIVVAFLVGVAVGGAGKGGTTSAAAVESSAPATPVVAETTSTPTATPTPKASKVAVPDDVTKGGITEGAADIACEQYGKAMYPYGFKDHYLMGEIASRIEHGKWFMKDEVTVTNAYNAERDTVMECKVGGTEADPVVTYFLVY